jgi:hypothetical protein
MVETVTSYRSCTGKLFATRQEAVDAEIEQAADILVGLSKQSFIMAAKGEGDLVSVRAAIRRLNDAMPTDHPAPAEPPR